MKKCLSVLLMLINVLLLCSCSNKTNNTNLTETQITTYESSTTDSDSNSFIDSLSDDSDMLMSGGLNYSYSETTPLEYNGDDIVMNIKLNISNSMATDMGVYLNVQGLFLPFSLCEYSDDSFTKSIADESEANIFHQLNFDKEHCNNNTDRFFAVRFNPDMFPKGTVIYPDVVCSVNNTYLPEEKGDVNISASSIFGIYPPALKINCEAKEQYEICGECKITPMTEEDADENDNENIKAEILETGDDSFQYFLSADKGDSVKLTARIHNVYDEFINYDAQEAVITVLVNDIPYAAFDGSKYLGISVDKNNYYTYDFSLDTNELNRMNKVQLYVCQLKGSEENPYNTIAVSSPLYVQVN